MARKKVLLAVDSLENTYKFHQIAVSLDVEEVPVKGRDIEDVLRTDADIDLVVYEAHTDVSEEMSRLEQSLPADGDTSLLLVVEDSMIPGMRLPAQTRSDFVTYRASAAECELRMHHLLWSGAEGDSADFVRVGGMIINLATYQVTINGEPLDLTYLEYALLSFLATHPGRTFSRQALLHRVWGLDYYGGSRTVDVHVRRIRAKLGPDLSLHLKTVRGVGYLWQD